MFRILIITSLIAAWAIWFAGIRKQAGIESQIPFAVRYDNSKYFKKVVGKELFLRVSRKAPTAAAFTVGLDPAASPYAIFRWSLIALLGWFHFCFISSFAKPILSWRITKLNLFFLPPTIVVLLSIATIVRRFGFAGAENIAFAIGVLQMATIGVTFFIGLFSIPASIGFFIVKVIRSRKAASTTQGKAELPGPVVKRKLIDGVWYDE